MTPDFASALPWFGAGVVLLLIRATVPRSTRRSLRLARELLLPVVMFAAVVLTANHYFLDGLAGAAIVLASYAWAVTRERRTDAPTFATTVSPTNEAEYRGRP